MTAKTASRSDEHFTQDEFRRWLEDRPQSHINHYELINGRIVMRLPAGWPDAQRHTVTVFHLGERGYDAGRTFSTGTIKPRVLHSSTCPSRTSLRSDAGTRR
ncbi:MAG TPA: hypothetical protein VMW56_02995 [Candidatus Margulisiibacteriota bacterium]|nr:hypothetical protein [Candidatus Margulisiibacteriota bacterium]